MQRSLVLALSVVVLLATAPRTVVAQDGPADVFRAFWATRLSPADPAAARFRSKASLERLADLRREDQENAANMLEFLAAMHADLQDAADIASIQTTSDAADRATLMVRLIGKNGALPSRLPSQATVAMVREADGWKIHNEEYASGGSPPVNAAPDVASEPEAGDVPMEASACGSPSVLGDPTAPHVLLLSGTAGDGRVHFRDARVRLSEGSLSVELPTFNEHSITIRASDAAAAPGRYEANLSVEGVMGFAGCPTLPSRVLTDDFSQPAPVGHVEWERGSEPGRANVSFSFADPATGDTDVSGTLKGVPVVDVTPGPLLDGSLMRAATSEVAPTAGSVRHEPGRRSLMIELFFDTANESSSEIVEVDDFSGAQGLTIASRWSGTARVVLVREFNGASIDIEVREVPEGALADEDALKAQFSTTGTLVARVRTDRVATIPSLPELMP